MYKTGFDLVSCDLLATFPAVSRSKVDFPIPGSPAINVTEPGTNPPPKTRSNSENPLGMRMLSSA